MKDVKDINRDTLIQANNENLEAVARAFSEEEATLVLDILVEKYPTLVFKALSRSHATMRDKLNYINNVFSDDRK